MNARLKALAIRAVDRLFAALPRPRPDRAKLRACRIVSHRGEHDNRGVPENSMAAFEGAAAAGVWGVEFDVRWTRDLEPVVFHDPDTQRLFGVRRRIGAMTLNELRTAFPVVPTLGEVVRRFGGRLHLMVEMKAEPYPRPARQNRVLARLFSRLEPGRDYHVMSLDPATLRRVDFLPATARLPIAEAFPGNASRVALSEHYGGVTGHYLLVTDRMLRRHRARRQRVGTGFIASGNSLFREINRGVTWIYSDRAAALQRLCGAR